MRESKILRQTNPEFLRRLPSEEGVIGVRPRCPECTGTLKRDDYYIGTKLRLRVKCNRCGAFFAIKDFWPVPGHKL